MKISENSMFKLLNNLATSCFIKNIFQSEFKMSDSLCGFAEGLRCVLATTIVIVQVQDKNRDDWMPDDRIGNPFD